MDNTLEGWYFSIPIVTRLYITTVALTTFACQIDIIQPLQLYFNWDLIIRKQEYWRLFSSFFFFGYFNVDFLFHLFFLVRHCSSLEEGSFRRRPADFLWMLMFGAASIICIVTFVPKLTMNFLGSALSFMIVYVWSRRNRFIQMNFFGIFTFSAPYLPWFYFFFNIVINKHVSIPDIIGIIVGHIYFFLEDVYPATSGRRLLQTPGILKWMINPPPERVVASPAPAPRPRPDTDAAGVGHEE